MSNTIQAVLRDGARKLAEAGIDGAVRDARRLMASAIDVQPKNVTLRLHDTIMHGQRCRFERLISERLKRIPVSRLLATREFYGRVFFVNEDVLDPRPDTETLIEVALSAPFSQVLDLGTGSGAIVHTLLGENTDATAVATDISEDALEVACDNPLLEDYSERVEFILSDWFEGVRGTFDLIVSNPPYIALKEMDGLMPEVRDHDPRIALTDEGDGLGAYRAIAAGLNDHLDPGGRVLLEIGPTKAPAVSTLLAGAGLEGICVHPDLDGRDRVVEAKKPV